MLKVLFVDDDKDVSELFKVVGEQSRVWSMTFTSGTDALAFLHNNDVDAVIMDLMMSPIDGLTLAEQIRLNEENQPNKKKTELVFLTGVEITDAIERVAKRTNVRKIYQKPCDLPQMLEEVKGWFVSAKGNSV